MANEFREIEGESERKPLYQNPKERKATSRDSRGRQKRGATTTSGATIAPWQIGDCAHKRECQLVECSGPILILSRSDCEMTHSHSLTRGDGLVPHWTRARNGYFPPPVGVPSTRPRWWLRVPLPLPSPPVLSAVPVVTDGDSGTGSSSSVESSFCGGPSRLSAAMSILLGGSRAAAGVAADASNNRISKDQ